MPLKSRKQVREDFASRGWTYSGWARRHGYSSNMVIAIVNDDDTKPRYKLSRGESHDIAVRLGIKEGVLSSTALSNSRFATA